MTFANDGSFSPIFTIPDNAAVESGPADTSSTTGAAFLLTVPVLSVRQRTSYLSQSLLAGQSQ